MNLEQLIKQVEESYTQMADQLHSVREQQDWRLAPDEWSCRYLAGHMATTDSECWLPRIERLAAGERPYFDTYLNTGRDFSEHNLLEWVAQWGVCRHQIVAFVQTLEPKQLAVAGTHDWFGEVTIPDLLLEMYTHDMGHIDEMQPMLAAYSELGGS